MKSLPRHESLKELSRHHHHALRVVLKIKKALTDDVTVATLQQLQEEVAQFWEPGGQDHFREEEEILLPAYSRFGSPRHEEIIEMLMEHVHIRALVSEIGEIEIDEQDAASVEKLTGLIRELGESLEVHVRREERVIFPMMEAALPEDVLQKLAPYFHEFHENDHR